MANGNANHEFAVMYHRGITNDIRFTLDFFDGQSFPNPIDTEENDVKFSELVDFLNSDSAPSNRAAVKRAILTVMKLIKQGGFADEVVYYDAVPALVRHLRPPQATDCDGEPFQPHEVEKKCAHILRLLAVNPKRRQYIAEAGALPCLVDLLSRHKTSAISTPLIGLLRRAADAICNLSIENTTNKNCIRIEGGIPRLVELLEFNSTKVQIAAASALATLALDNDDNKKQIVGCNALPILVLMLRSDDPMIHYAAVLAIENLVHSSPDIVKEVLLVGALSPVICLLLSSRCPKSKKLAALLLGQFAATGSDCQAQISQGGAIPTLVDMLSSPHVEHRKVSVFAIGRLAQDPCNQAIIANTGAIEPLLNILDSNKIPLQCDAALALNALVDNEGIVANIIKAGGFEKLKDGHFKDPPTKDCVATTLKRLEEKMHGQVLEHLIFNMRFVEKNIQICVAISLVYLCAPRDCKTIFIDNKGLDLLLDILTSSSESSVKEKCNASAALHKLAAKASSLVSSFGASPSPPPQMHLGGEYVNNAKLSDLTFLVEGRIFYAHKDCLFSSDIFQAMFDNGSVVIPNIKWEVFELMMRFMYTGTVDVNLDIAQDLFRAADQYNLGGLKRICEDAIVRDISLENVKSKYNMAKALNATTLKHACILFMLKNFFKLRSKPWYYRMISRIVPDIRMFFSTLLTMTGEKSENVQSCKFSTLTVRSDEPTDS